jgi:hypothetical protein
MPKGVKPFSEADKRAAIELWKAGILLKRIREQLGMSERGLRNIFSYAKKHPGDPVARKIGWSGRPPKVSLGTIMQIKRKVLRNPTTHYSTCVVIKLLIKIIFSVLIVFFFSTGTEFVRRLYYSSLL